MSLQGIKVLSSSEMQNIEKAEIKKGVDNAAFMEKAGEEIANKIQKALKSNLIKINKKTTKIKIVLIAGKGNNAGDGFVALRHLLKKGYETRVLQLCQDSQYSLLCKRNCRLYLEAGGQAKFINDPKRLVFHHDEIILDGLFGTGLKGDMDNLLAASIEKINQAKNFTISIDIPSGLDGDSGKLLPVAIQADQTFYLGAPKKGFFLEQGWNYVGQLEAIDFGLRKAALDQAEADFYLVDETSACQLLPEIQRSQHKYEAGYVVGIAGSPSMEGAANLSARAAIRAGAGLVRVFLSGKKIDYKKLSDEIIKEHLELDNIKMTLEACDKAAAVFIGPGLGREKETAEILKELLAKITKPVVLDADGLYFLAQNPQTVLPQETVLTPHRGEMLTLLNLPGQKLKDEPLFEKCQQFVDKKNCVLVLKGAPSFIFRKAEKPLIIPRGDPGMATAGSGDVLAGIIAALLAKKLKTDEAAILGVLIHSLAGEKAAQEKSSYSLMASDLIEALPLVFKTLKSS